ncbi:MAG: 4-hydroxy-tetrahydrodipicolinate synthase [Bacteroidota bacterium]
MKNNKYRGTGVALVTPFRKDGSIDFKSLSQLTEYVIEKGVDYLVVNGTTGESATISKDEKSAIVASVVEVNNKRKPVVVGFGGNSTSEVVNAIKGFDFDGVDAILSVCPYYNKPSQKGIYQHFKAVANASSVPVFLYNVPGRTVVNIEPETTLQLAKDFDNIIGIKEATDNIDQVMKLIAAKPKEFLVVGGDDALGLPLLACGVDGVISVISNAYPEEYSAMIKAGLKNDIAKARTIHYQLIPVMETLLTMNNPGGIKAVLSIMGLIENYLRLPLVPVSKTHFGKLQEMMGSVKLQEKV